MIEEFLKQRFGSVGGSDLSTFKTNAKGYAGIDGINKTQFDKLAEQYFEFDEEFYGIKPDVRGRELEPRAIALSGEWAKETTIYEFGDGTHSSPDAVDNVEAPETVLEIKCLGPGNHLLAYVLRETPLEMVEALGYKYQILNYFRIPTVDLVVMRFYNPNAKQCEIRAFEVKFKREDIDLEEVNGIVEKIAKLKEKIEEKIDA